MLALAFFTVFFRLGSYGLIDADEGRYASIPREMLARGDWVVPTLNGAEFFDKPVLLYWSQMLSFKAFGISELTARLAPALWALAAIGAVYALSRRTFGARAGFLSAAILATTTMWPVLGRTIITDTPLASLTTIALCLWWLAHTEKRAEKPASFLEAHRQTLWFALFWISLALGVLSKGPVAILLCFGAIIPYLLWCRPQKGWNMGALWGVPLMVLVAAPWFILIQLREPEFGRLFWWEQNFARFMGSKGVPDHWEAPYYFLPFLPAVFFPWSLFIPRALGRVLPTIRAARSENNEKARAAFFLMVGALFTLVFFSASKSKIVSYIAPMVPLVCAILGAYINSQWEKKQLRFEAALLASLAAVAGIAAFVFAPKAGVKLGADNATLWISVLGVVMVAWAGTLAYSSRTSKTQYIFGATVGGSALFLATAVSLWCALAPTMTTKPLLAQLRPALSPDARVLSVGFIQSMSFYTGRRTAVDGVIGGKEGADLSKIPDELLPAWEEMGQDERNRYFYGNSDDLERALAQPGPVFVVARNSRLKGTWDDLDDEMYVLARNKRYTLVGNREAWEHFEKNRK